MKIARIKVGRKTTYALVEEGGFNLVEGSPVFGNWKPTGQMVPVAEAKLLAPVTPSQIIAIGLNYRAHAEETHAAIPTAPVVFIKSSSAINGPEMPIVLPKMAPSEVDYEAELVIVMGRKAKNVSAEDADKYILGYTCGNDVSARDCQIKKDKQWARGKSFDTFAPIGPWIATGIDPGHLRITSTLNGQTMQDSNTADMIFSVGFLVSYLSQCMTLHPGAVIFTGTPSGVGVGRNPQVFLKDGDVVAVEIEGIGKLSNTVKGE